MKSWLTSQFRDNIEFIVTIVMVSLIVIVVSVIIITCFRHNCCHLPSDSGQCNCNISTSELHGNGYNGNIAVVMGTMVISR